MPAPLKYACQRAAIHMIIMDHYRALAACVGANNLSDFTRDLNLYSAILIGQCEGRPMGATKLAEYSGQPKTTTLRKLAKMQQDGNVIREGDLYYINPEVANHDDVIRAYKRFRRDLARSLETLSRLDF